MPSQEDLDRLINSYRGSYLPPVDLLKYIGGPESPLMALSRFVHNNTQPPTDIASGASEGHKFESSQKPAELYVQLPLFTEKIMIRNEEELTVPEPSEQQKAALALAEKAQREIDEAILRGQLPPRKISLVPVVVKESHQDRLNRLRQEQQDKKDRKAAKQAKASRKANRHKKS